MSSRDDEDYYYDDLGEDEEGPRFGWKVASIIIIVLTLVLNLVTLGLIIFRRTANSLINKAFLTLAIVDIIYGTFVSPFFIENYIHVDWDRGIGYCSFYIFIFTFHDLFIPLTLILFSAYISLKFSGVENALKFKKQLYITSFVVILLFSIFFSIPATLHSGIFKENDDDGFREECQTYDKYTMVLSYFLGSSLLFCFTMSFFFSLCIVGSPLLRDVYDDPRAYRQRWRLLLTISLVNSFYIICGFLLNFKEVSRFVYDCCQVKEPFISTNTLTYDIWSLVFAVSEPFLRPLACLSFYFKYISTDPDVEDRYRRGYLR